MPKKQSIIVNMLLLVLVLTISLALFEIGFRLFHPQLTTARAERIAPKIYMPSNDTLWSFRPNARDNLVSGIGNEFDVMIEINSYGLRDHKFTMADLDGKTIIAAVGDSFTYGWGVELDDIYMKRLEDKLNAGSGNSKKFITINMGYADGSLTTDVQYMYLKNKGMAFKPEILVLAYYVGNDILEIGKNTWEKTDPQGFPTKVSTSTSFIDQEGRLRRVYSNATRRGVATEINDFLNRHSHTVAFAKKVYFSAFLNAPDENHLENYSQEYILYLNKSMKLLLGISDLARQNNATLIIVLIPSKVQVESNAWKMYEKYYGDNAQRNNPQELLIGFCEQNSLRCIDLLPKMIDSSEFYYPIDGHWNPKGHELASDALGKYLEEEGLIR